MDYKTRLLSLCNRIAMQDPGAPAVAQELATITGHILRANCEDAGERDSALEAMHEAMTAAAQSAVTIRKSKWSQ